MTTIDQQKIFDIKSEKDFRNIALDIFRYQASENEVYSAFVKALGIKSGSITDIHTIPFLPIELFKSQAIQCGTDSPEIVFSSSGTTGSTQSKHPVKDLSIYIESFRKGFQYFYGDISKYTLLALLPSYQERDGSLIYMVDDLIKSSNNADSGYFLYNHEELNAVLLRLKAERKKTILMGVTYALLDFIEVHTLNFPELVVMETGGMKGKRKEMIREELHNLLCAGFGVAKIHSEYGMTDLANIHSCSFLSTQDLGKKHTDGSFEILGRFDNSDIRGCNLLVQ